MIRMQGRSPEGAARSSGDAGALRSDAGVVAMTKGMEIALALRAKIDLEGSSWLSILHSLHP